MAITKIIGTVHPSATNGKHGSMKKLIDYVINPKKTSEGVLTGAANCRLDHALEDMVETKVRYGQDSDNPKNRQMYHYVISWSAEDEDITEEKAMKVIREFVEEYLGNEYEAVYSVHKDREHIHGHIAFNSVNYRTGRKFRYEDGDWASKIQPLVDQICKRNGLHSLEEDTGQTLEQYDEERKSKKTRRTQEKRKQNRENGKRQKNNYHKDKEENYAWNDHVKEDIDYAIQNSSTYDEFSEYLQTIGYQIKSGTSEKYGPYIKMKAPGMEIFRKTYQLGPEYTLKRIQERIEIKNKPLPVFVIPVTTRLVIPVRYVTRYRKIPMNPHLKRYYKFLYRIGVKSVFAKRNYKEIKETLRRIERSDRKLTLAVENKVANKESAEKLKIKMQEQLESLQGEQRALLHKHEPYKFMLAAYKKAEKMKPDYEAFQNGDETKKNVAKQYEELVSSYQKYGFSEDEIDLYRRQKNAELREMRERISKAKEDVTIAEELIQEHRNGYDVLFNREEEAFYKSITEEPAEAKERSRT